jgi:hypothetical protein
MTDEDWLEILRLIQAELRQVGLGSIADLSGLDDDTFEGRRSYGAQKLAYLMLQALDRHLSIHSPKTVEQAMQMIRQNVETRGIDAAILVNNGDDIEVEEREDEEVLRGDERIPSAMEDLRILIGQLLEADSSGGEGGATFE